MTSLASEPAGATPLTEAERHGLLLPALTRAELNRAEAANISDAMSWLFLSRRRLRPELVTDEEWLKRLHRRMYGQVWAWAGQYRTADRNLGVPYWQVRVDIRGILGDVRAWLADPTDSRYSDDECAIRFGYRLVVVHPFPNGNGRHSRQAALYLAGALGAQRPTWGAGLGLSTPDLRRLYIAALVQADRTDDVSALVTFALS